MATITKNRKPESPVADVLVVTTDRLADERADVPVLDRPKVAALATVVLGLTAFDSDYHACRTFAIDAAIKYLATLRRIVRESGL